MKWITFYDVGLMIGLRRLHTLPSLEGYDGNFTGISGYSTVDLPKRGYLDLVPHLDRSGGIVELN